MKTLKDVTLLNLCNLIDDNFCLPLLHSMLKFSNSFVHKSFPKLK